MSQSMSDKPPDSSQEDSLKLEISNVVPKVSNASTPTSASKRRRAFRRATKSTASLVNAVHAYFKNEKQLGSPKNLQKPALRTSEALGISEHLVYDIQKKMAEHDNDPTEPFPDDEEEEKRDRSSDVPDAFFARIRKIIADMHREKLVPTLNSLLNRVRQDWSGDDSWKWSRTTLYNTLSRLGFKYTSRKSHSHVLHECLDIRAKRIRFIRSIREFRNAGAPIFYTGDTRFGIHSTPEKTWVSRGKGSPKIAGDKGSYFVLAQIGSATTGIIKDCGLIYNCKRPTEHVHGDLPVDVFLKWLDETVLPQICKQLDPVLVLNNTPHHQTLTAETKPAESSWSKKQLAEWLVAHGIQTLNCTTAKEYLSAFTRIELQTLCNKHHPEPVLEVDVLAKKHGANILFLPPLHPELNPVEQIWDRVLKAPLPIISSAADAPDLSQIKENILETVNAVDASALSGLEASCRQFENAYFQAEVEDIESHDEEE
eukprot:gene6603-9413_t